MSLSEKDRAQLGPRPATYVCAGCPAYETEKWREPSGDGETYDRGQYAWCNAAGRRSMGSYHYDHTSTPEWCPAREQPPQEGAGEPVAEGTLTPEYYGGNCPVGMVQVEFVGCDPEARIGRYSRKPTKTAFIELYVDGQRYRIDAGDISERCFDGKPRRGVHINYPMGAELGDRSMNALNLSVPGSEPFWLPSPPTDPRAKALEEATGAQAVIRGGKIEISIDVDALPVIVSGSCAAADVMSGLWKVTDAEVFAKEVCHALNDENEIGTTPVHVMFDKAFMHAIEQGAEGIEEATEGEFETEAARLQAALTPSDQPVKGETHNGD